MRLIIHIKMRYAIILFLLSFLSIFCISTYAISSSLTDDEGAEACASWGADSTDLVQHYIAYRAAVDSMNYLSAVYDWREVYMNAPGARETTHRDGIIMFRSFIEAAESATERSDHIDTLMMIYDARIRCFGNEGVNLGRKAFELYKYKPRERKQVHNIMKESIRLLGNKSVHYTLYPFFSLSLDRYNKGLIDDKEMFKVHKRLTNICLANIENGHPDASKYQDVIDKMNKHITSVTKSEVKDCQDVFSTYGKEHYEDLENADKKRLYYIKLKQFGCYDDEDLIRLSEQMNELEADTARSRFLAHYFLEEKDSIKAVHYFLKEIEAQQSLRRKAELYLDLALLQRFSYNDNEAARKMIENAINVEPSWGKPYIALGDLYASAIKSCSEGEEYYPAMYITVESYYSALASDENYRAEASRLINEYKQYFPSAEKMSTLGYADGEIIKVDCWIGRDTMVRTR